MTADAAPDPHRSEMGDAVLPLVFDPFEAPTTEPLTEPPVAPPRVEVRRSKRRRRTVSAYREGDLVVVLLPARMTKAEEREWVGIMLERLEAQDRRSRPSDAQLLKRAHRLSQRYLDGRAVASSVRWVSNQRTRWGSCTVDDRAIRLSDRLQAMPEWVQDYVLLHELAHLLEPSHGPEFWELLRPYPELERAKGFLDGWSLALQQAGVSE
ncbi:MAG TPA: SprT-like domain-containing protein [Actinomycetes bacterium]|nr:SprT-like domain-containing protein [Actinomycetes bacterium]